LVDAYLDKGLWDYILGFLMLLTVILLFVFRRKRIKEESKFDRTMLGELDHAIANTRSLVHISNMMIYCYLLPVGLFTIGKLIYFDASSGKWLLLVAMYAVAYFLIRWERKYQHLPRKANLEILRAKLMEDK
jgi:preprotein translocase subunit YajC